MASDWIWAIDENGKPTKCKAKPENRGKRNCKHLAHAKPNEDVNALMNRYNISKETLEEEMRKDSVESITQDEVDEFASRLDEICGTRVTMENYEEVLKSLTPEQIDKLNKLGFEAAPAFSLPITDEMYDEVNTSNKIYFSELPSYKIGGKQTAINAMFGSVGLVPVQGGEEYCIQGNYKDGLSDEEYFEKQFSTRGSQIQKTVSVSAPGATARQVFYGLSDAEVIEDCGGDHSHGIMGCKAQKGFCKKCAEHSGMKVEEGQLVGSIASTHLTEGLTQAALNSIHSSGKGNDKEEWMVIKDTLLGSKSSGIIKTALEKETTEEARQAIFDGLKDHYERAHIGIDDYNIEIISRQLTSYVVDGGQLRPVKDGELCSIPSISAIGSQGNVFLQAELRTAYNYITKPQVFENKRNAVTEIM